jgi:GH24 family phage-related lysozyme (muramidase)
MEPEYLQDLIAHEGVIPWLYCDIKGLPTIGIGNLAGTEQAFVALPMVHQGGAHATDEEKRDVYARTLGAFAKGMTAMGYRCRSDLRLDHNDTLSLVTKRLETEFIPGIKAVCHDFDEWPLAARRATVDMGYSLGVHGLVHGHPSLVAALQARDWATAAGECHRRKDGEDPKDPTTWGTRNAWTRKMYLAAMG